MTEMIFFEPDRIQEEMDKSLSAGLRMLADSLDAGTIDGKCIDVIGFGGPRRDPRAHVMLRIDLAAPIRQPVTQPALPELDQAQVVDLSELAPASWPGKLTKDKLESIVMGLLIPNQAMSVRLAHELLNRNKDDAKYAHEMLAEIEEEG